MHVQTVGHPPSHAQHPRVHAGHVDRGVGHVEAAGRPLRVHERQLVEAPVEVERGVPAEGGEAGAHRPHVLLEARSRRVEGDAVAPLRMGADLGAEPEAETSAGRVGQLPCALGVDHRAAGEGHRHARQHLQPGRGQGRRRAREVRGAAGLREDEAVEAGQEGLGGQPLHVRQPAGRRHHIDLHHRRVAHRRGSAGHDRAAARRSSSSGGTSSTWVAMNHWLPAASTTLARRSP